MSMSEDGDDMSTLCPTKNPQKYSSNDRQSSFHEQTKIEHCDSIVSNQTPSAHEHPATFLFPTQPIETSRIETQQSFSSQRKLIHEPHMSQDRKRVAGALPFYYQESKATQPKNHAAAVLRPTNYLNTTNQQNFENDTVARNEPEYLSVGMETSQMDIILSPKYSPNHPSKKSRTYAQSKMSPCDISTSGRKEVISNISHSNHQKLSDISNADTSTHDNFNHMYLDDSMDFFSLLYSPKYQQCSWMHPDCSPIKPIDKVIPEPSTSMSQDTCKNNDPRAQYEHFQGAALSAPAPTTNQQVYSCLHSHPGSSSHSYSYPNSNLYSQSYPLSQVQDHHRFYQYRPHSQNELMSQHLKTVREPYSQVDGQLLHSSSALPMAAQTYNITNGGESLPSHVYDHLCDMTCNLDSGHADKNTRIDSVEKLLNNPGGSAQETCWIGRDSHGFASDLVVLEENKENLAYEAEKQIFEPMSTPTRRKKTNTFLAYPLNQDPLFGSPNQSGISNNNYSFPQLSPIHHTSSPRRFSTIPRF